MNFDWRSWLFLPRAVTEWARSVDRLHLFVISVTMVGAFVMLALAIYWVVRYRRRGKPSPTPRIVAPRWFELTWAGGLLALFVLWWVLGFQQYLGYARPPGQTDSVYVVAKQWMWKFSYSNGDASAGILVVERDTPVRLVLTSRDVVHSFYVPAFRLKQDVLPGRYTTLWFEPDEAGVYDVYCAEFCGTSHSQMRAAVVVLPPADFAEWTDGNVPPLVDEAGRRLGVEWNVERAPEGEDLVSLGTRVATESGCFSCHTTDGQPHIGPTWRGLYGRRVELEDGSEVTATEAYLTQSMMEPQADVVAGFDPVMPTYLGELTSAEVAGIVEFIKSLEAGGSSARVKLPDVRVPDEAAAADEPETGAGGAAGAPATNGGTEP